MMIKHPFFEEDEQFGFIDVVASEEELGRMFNISRRQWDIVTDEEAYWSVLCDDEWRSNQLTDEKLVKFYESGKDYLNDFLALCEKHNVKPSGVGLELGPGVGRITNHLAGLFDKLYAADISHHNLDICNRYLELKEIKNVETRLLLRHDDITLIGGIDCFFSVITLQHNTPPMQLYFLSMILESLKPGGIAYFQVLTSGYDNKYHFNTNGHINFHKMTFKPQIEMHILPRLYIGHVIEDANCNVLDVVEDSYGGPGPKSYTFLVQKV